MFAPQQSTAISIGLIVIAICTIVRVILSNHLDREFYDRESISRRTKDRRERTITVIYYAIILLAIVVAGAIHA
jgi:uncharacterized membrane protein YidH (DUF202 family)